MKYLRWLLAGLLALYALMSALPASFTVLHKLNLLILPEMIKSHGALMDAISWPRVLVLWAAVILYGVAAWRLAFRKGRAFVAWAIAFVLDALCWWWMQGPVYEATFPPSQRQADLTIFAVMALVGALVAWVESRKTATN